jgi:WD40 repeat protein
VNGVGWNASGKKLASGSNDETVFMLFLFHLLLSVSCEHPTEITQPSINRRVYGAWTRPGTADRRPTLRYGPIGNPQLFCSKQIYCCTLETHDLCFLQNQGHTDSIDQLAWHPTDENIIATASSDKTVSPSDIH